MSGRPRAAWRYVPAGELADRPHVVVDGAASPATACTLSHWPRTPTPRQLWADTSAEIVLRALRRPRLLPAGVELATVDHYDADGAIALALLVVGGLAERHGVVLADAARAGDFDVIRSRRGALVAFALEALRARSASSSGAAAVSDDEACRPGRAPDATAAATYAALELLPSLVEEPEEFEDLWGPEASAYDAACTLRDRQTVRIEEHPALDLAVVRGDHDALAAAGAGWNGAAVHPAAVHSATACLRVAVVAGAHYELHFRYETWVRLTGRRPRLRVDLSALAETLTEAEADRGRWRFDGAGAITPVLCRADGAESTLSPERWLAEVGQALDALDRRAPAWDPYGATMSEPAPLPS